MDYKMKILFSLAISTLLCHLCHGGASSVSIEISNGNGTTVSTGTINAQMNEDLTITCKYAGTPSFDEYYFLTYKAMSVDSYQHVYTRGSISHPWSDNAEKYQGSSDFNEADRFTLTFEINGVEISDDGEYKCDGTSDAEGMNEVVTPSKASIKVYANVASVELQNVDNGKYKIEDDDRAQTINCKSFNGSLPEMQLYIGGTLVGNFEVTESGEMEFEGTYRYDFSANDHDKEIKCVAIVPGFETQKMSSEAIIAVESKPVITCAAKEIEAMKGEKVTIECLISARPALTMVTWFNQDTGSQIGRAEDKPELGLKSTFDDSADPKKATLEVTIQTSSFPIRYNLVAENSVGSSDQQIQILKKSSAGPVGGGDNASSVMQPFSVLFLLFLALLRLNL